MGVTKVWKLCFLWWVKCTLQKRLFSFVLTPMLSDNGKNDRPIISPSFSQCLSSFPRHAPPFPYHPPLSLRLTCSLTSAKVSPTSAPNIPWHLPFAWCPPPSPQHKLGVGNVPCHLPKHKLGVAKVPHRFPNIRWRLHVSRVISPRPLSSPLSSQHPLSYPP